MVVFQAGTVVETFVNQQIIFKLSSPSDVNPGVPTNSSDLSQSTPLTCKLNSSTKDLTNHEGSDHKIHIGSKVHGIDSYYITSGCVGYYNHA